MLYAKQGNLSTESLPIRFIVEGIGKIYFNHGYDIAAHRWWNTIIFVPKKKKNCDDFLWCEKPVLGISVPFLLLLNGLFGVDDGFEQRDRRFHVIRPHVVRERRFVRLLMIQAQMRIDRLPLREILAAQRAREPLRHAAIEIQMRAETPEMRVRMGAAAQAVPALLLGVVTRVICVTINWKFFEKKMKGTEYSWRKIEGNLLKEKNNSWKNQYYDTQKRVFYSTTIVRNAQNQLYIASTQGRKSTERMMTTFALRPGWKKIISTKKNDKSDSNKKKDQGNRIKNKGGIQSMRAFMLFLNSLFKCFKESWNIDFKAR